MEYQDPYELLTTDEIIEEFPQAAKQGKWTPSRLVSVWRSGGLVGGWDGTLNRYKFSRWSVIAYIEHINRLLDSQRINIPKTG